MKKSAIKKVIELSVLGYAPEEISEELGHDEQEIIDILNEYDPEEQDSMAGLSGIEKSNALKERELRLREKDAQVKTEKMKRSILKEFVTLCEGIIDHVRGSIWERDSLKKTKSEITDLIDKTQEVFEFDEEKMAENSVYEILQVLKSEFAGLSKNDPDYKVRIEWSNEKIEMLEHAIGIDNFDETDFDTEDFNRQKANGAFIRFIEILKKIEGKKVDRDRVTQIQNDVEFLRETLTQDILGVDGEFDQEIEVLDSITEYLKEISIRIDESFWGEKTLSLPKAIDMALEEVGFKEQEEV